MYNNRWSHIAEAPGSATRLDNATLQPVSVEDCLESGVANRRTSSLAPSDPHGRETFPVIRDDLEHLPLLENFLGGAHPTSYLHVNNCCSGALVINVPERVFP